MTPNRVYTRSLVGDRRVEGDIGRVVGDQGVRRRESLDRRAVPSHEHGTLLGPVNVQHSAVNPDGTDGLTGLVAGLPPTSSYELIRVLADGDLVVTEVSSREGRDPLLRRS